jgi:hypothetical protein
MLLHKSGTELRKLRVQDSAAHVMPDMIYT